MYFFVHDAQNPTIAYIPELSIFSNYILPYYSVNRFYKSQVFCPGRLKLLSVKDCSEFIPLILLNQLLFYVSELK